MNWRERVFSGLWPYQCTNVIMDLTKITLVVICLQTCLAQRQFFRERPSNVTVVQGRDVQLRCIVGNEEKVGNTKWTKNSEYMSFGAYPRYRKEGDPARGEYFLSISNAQLEDDDEYFCQVDPAAGEETHLMASAHVNVLVPPSKLSLDGSQHTGRIEVKADASFDVSCRALGAKPAAKLVWYRNGVRVPEDHFQSDVSSEGDKRYTTVSKLRFVARREDNDAVFTCEADHPATPPSRFLRDQFTLSVIYPPGQPVITGHNAGSAMISGDLVRLRCMAENGNPLPEVIWYRKSVSVGRNYSSTREYTMNEYSFIAQPADNDAEFRCEAFNVAAVSPLSSSICLSVYYAPEKVEIAGPDQAKLGDTVQMTCTSSASYPGSKLTWLIDGEPSYDQAQRNWLAATADGAGTGMQSSSSISIKISHRRPDIQVTCIAKNEKLPPSKQEIIGRRTIQIYYPPESVKVTVHGRMPLATGGRILLTCLARGGHPAPTIEWFKGEQRVTTVTSSRYDSTANATISEYSYVLTPQDNQATVRCGASNWASNGDRITDSITLSVHFPPETAVISPNPPEFVADESAELTCESGSGNPSPNVEWYRNDQQLISVISHNKTGSNGGWVIKKKLSFTPTLQDNRAMYECRVWSTIGRDVISEKVQLAVHYKPIFLVPTSQILDVLEGETITVNASAYGSPPVEQYIWTKEQSTIHSIPPRILINGPVIEITNTQRGDAGIYTCEARNRVGMSTMTATISVKYPAQIRRVTPSVYANQGENVSLVCEVAGHPSPPGVAKWERIGNGMNDSRMVQTGIKDGIMLTINGVRREDTGNYTCTAFNGIGRVDSKMTHVFIRQAPLLDHRSIYTKAASPIGKITELTCVADGIPEVKFTWYRERDLSGRAIRDYQHSIIHENDRISILSKHIGFTTYKSHVIIRDVQQKDYGTYRCVAENEIGSRSAEVKFGPPEPPEPPSIVRVLNKTHDTITLEWHPGFTGGLPTQFRIRYYVAGPGRISLERQKNILTTMTTTTIEGLKPKTSYVVSIQAVNDIGASGFVNITADTLDQPSTVQGTTKEDLPVLVIVLVALAGMILLIVNAALVVCFLRRHQRKKLEERAATARLGSSSRRKVQMYSGDGVIVGTDYHNDEKFGTDQRPRSAMSDGNSSIRTVIEVDGAGNKTGYVIAGGSPPLQSGYLLECVSHDYDEPPNSSTYADTLRSKTNSLQRYLAHAVYNVPRGAVRHPDCEEGSEITYVAGQLVDDVFPPPSMTGQLRDPVQDYGPHSYDQSCLSNERCSPHHVPQSQCPPYPEVRPLLSAFGPNDALPVHGSPVRNNSAHTACPTLSTFATLPRSRNLPHDVNNPDCLSGDLL